MSDIRERTKAAVFAIMKARADCNLEVRGLRLIDIARLVQRSNAEVGPAVDGLIAEHQITRIRRGNNMGPAVYRIGELTEAAPFRPSIESVTVYTPNRISFGLPAQIPISLPRLRCLEQSGVE